MLRRNRTGALNPFEAIRDVQSVPQVVPRLDIDPEFNNSLQLKYFDCHQQVWTALKSSVIDIDAIEPYYR